MRYCILIAACFIIFGAAPALAGNWTIDYAHSHVGFIGTQSEAKFEGSFGKFTATIDLDPDKPETGKITATIDMASAATGSADRDGNLPQRDWFDTGKFPQAQFVSTGIKKTGDSSYVAQGNLTIKGITRPVTLPFTLRKEGGHWRAQGKTTLARTDFHVGEGSWANEDYVKYAVDVTIDIVASPQA